MITVYHAPRSRSLRVIWLLEEIGDPYNIEISSIPAPAEYLDVNPIGTYPAIDDDGVRLNESLAILQYITGRRLFGLAEGAPSFTVGPVPSPADYAAHLQFLHYGEASLQSAVSALFRTKVMGGEDQNNWTATDARTQLIRRLKLLEDRLADGRDYIMGDAFTIADISVGTALLAFAPLGLDDELSDNIKAYRARLQAREAFQRALTK